MSPDTDNQNAKAVRELAEQIAEATRSDDIVALSATMVTRTGDVRMPFSFVIGSHVLLLGGMEIAKSQIIQSAAKATDQLVANANGPRPSICPKALVLGGCDWPRCDCAERTPN